MDKRFLFIYNPISGGAKNNFVRSFEKAKHLFPNHELMITTHVGHARELTNRYKSEFDVMVAVGGDGTVNEIASSIVHSNTSLGIIPLGSGNGFARHLKIPMSASKALQKLSKSNPEPQDVIEVNGQYFLNVAGVGFDGHVSLMFNQTKARGFWSYAKLALVEYIRYKEFMYTLIVDGTTCEGNAFVIAFANSTQYGNQFHIAPNATSDDGIIHISILRKPHVLAVPFLVYKVFKGRITGSKYFKELSGKDITLKSNGQLAMHYDGEVYQETGEDELHFRILPKAVNVLQ